MTVTEKYKYMYVYTHRESEVIMKVKDILGVMIDIVEIYEEVSVSENVEEMFRTLYKGDAGEVPFELENRKVFVIGADGPGVISIHVE